MNFLRACQRWVASRRDALDWVYIDQPDSWLHLWGPRAVHDATPLIVRFAMGESAAANSPLELGRAIQACRKADHVVVPHASAHRLLVSRGIPMSSITRIPDAAWSQTPVDPGQRAAVQTAFSRVSGDFLVPEDHRLLLVFSNYQRDSGLERMCRSLGRLLDDGAKLRIWIIGNGPELRNVHTLLREHAWHRDILLQGSFDAIEELLTVADLCVFPSPSADRQFLFPSVVSSGRPWLAVDSIETQALIGDDCGPGLIDEREFPLAERVRKWLNDPSELEQCAARGRQYLLEQNVVAGATDAWSQLLESPIGRGC
jgi:glycosyltransferase involved in cell wall biosynthesis